MGDAVARSETGLDIGVVAFEDGHDVRMVGVLEELDVGVAVREDFSSLVGNVGLVPSQLIDELESLGVVGPWLICPSLGVALAEVDTEGHQR